MTLLVTWAGTYAQPDSNRPTAPTSLMGAELSQLHIAQYDRIAPPHCVLINEYDE